MPTLLEANIIEDALTNLPDWSGDQQKLSRTAEFTDEQDAEVRRRLTVITDAMNHHADIERSGQRNKFTVSTHSEGGVTNLDIALASQIDSVIRRVTGQPPLAAPAEVLSTQAVTRAADEGRGAGSATDDSEPADGLK